MSMGGFGDVPSPDLSCTFFFPTGTALGGVPGLDAQGRCHEAAGGAGL